MSYAYLGVKTHGCETSTAVTVLEVPFPASCVDVPHADGAALITTDDLQ